YFRALFDRKAAAQFKAARGALDEDRGLSKGAAHFVSDDDAPHRGRDHEVDRLPEIARQLRSERGGEPPGAFGVHEDARTLQIIFAVAARGEKEMSVEESMGGTELGQDFIIGHW